MKVVSMHQPAYLPWLGYFHRVMLSDIFVFLDTVQFEKNSFTNRNKILTDNGSLWLTVPVGIKGHTKKRLSDIEISPDSGWKKKHIQSIRQNYAKAPYFEVFFADIEKIIANAGHSFCDFIFTMTAYFFKVMGISTPMVRSSSLPVEGVKSDLVKNICIALSADVYISGTLGKGYLDTHTFAKEQIRIIFQEYRHPVYPQLFEGFQPGMCIVDLLMNKGAEEATSIIMSGNLSRQEIKESVYAS